MRNQINNWYIALSISLMFHVAIFVTLPKIISKENILDNKNKIREIEIVTKSFEKIPSDRIKKKPPKLFSKNIPSPPHYLKNLIKKFTIDKKVINIDKPKFLDDSFKNVILSELPKEKDLKKNPAYMDYYQLIREKIRSNAYRYYNSNNQGQVFLTFIISCEGKLERIYLNSKSSNNELIEIALKSIKEAAPFPPFPPELNYPRLQFNISIYFKTN